MEPFAVQKLSGWGRYPVEECRVYRPEKRRAACDILRTCAGSLIARGLGRNYGDAAINGGGAVLDYTRLNRMLSFEADAGILECEAGVSLAEILDVFVPRGFFLPVLPGTKFVTVGGAIANDVHGKNHHVDGTFSRYVDQLTLLTPAGETMTCSPSENSEAFWATAGGIGLTGLILSARLRLRPVQTAYVKADYVRASNIEEALAAMNQSDERYTYSVAWVDCLSKGARLGRSVLMRGNPAAPGEVPRGSDPLRPRKKRAKTVPLDFPGFVLNPLSIKAFNSMFYAVHPSVEGRIVDFDTYFCPLDSIGHWNRMYGKNGFAQFQATFPYSDSGGLVSLLELISQSSCASFLAVLKRMGAQGPGMLSYPSEGYTITLDIPMRRDLAALLRKMERLVLEHGGRMYTAKDATALPETFAAMYPRLHEFRDVKRRLDPQNHFSSTQSRRLGITPAREGAHGD
ncbi:MAG TPA: FAD-binding oxidoreductase [Candidatus Bathyarchaeia archaeon]|nr:FAD-binding oxidoreductase [Candidatus Bathyarchaeia archaeon]